MPSLRPRPELSQSVSLAGSKVQDVDMLAEEKSQCTFDPEIDLKNIPSIQRVLRQHNVPFNSRSRRQVLVDLYNNLRSSSGQLSPNRIQPQTRSSSSNVASSHLESKQLKQILRQLGIPHRPNARYATLLKLYREHLQSTSTPLPKENSSHLEVENTDDPDDSIHLPADSSHSEPQISSNPKKRHINHSKKPVDPPKKRRTHSHHSIELPARSYKRKSRKNRDDDSIECQNFVLIPETIPALRPVKSKPLDQLATVPIEPLDQQTPATTPSPDQPEVPIERSQQSASTHRRRIRFQSSQSSSPPNSSTRHLDAQVEDVASQSIPNHHIPPSLIADPPSKIVKASKRKNQHTAPSKRTVDPHKKQRRNAHGSIKLPTQRPKRKSRRSHDDNSNENYNFTLLSHTIPALPTVQSQPSPAQPEGPIEPLEETPAQPAVPIESLEETPATTPSHAQPEVPIKRLQQPTSNPHCQSSQSSFPSDSHTGCIDAQAAPVASQSSSNPIQSALTPSNLHLPHVREPASTTAAEEYVGSPILGKQKELTSKQWLRPSKLSIYQIKEILINHKVNFGAFDDRITLSRLYRSLIDAERNGLPNKKSCKKSKDQSLAKTQRPRQSGSKNHRRYNVSSEINFTPSVANPPFMITSSGVDQPCTSAASTSEIANVDRNPMISPEDIELPAPQLNLSRECAPTILSNSVQQAAIDSNLAVVGSPLIDSSYHQKRLTGSNFDTARLVEVTSHEFGQDFPNPNLPDNLVSQSNPHVTNTCDDSQWRSEPGSKGNESYSDRIHVEFEASEDVLQDQQPSYSDQIQVEFEGSEDMLQDQQPSPLSNMNRPSEVPQVHCDLLTQQGLGLKRPKVSDELPSSKNLTLDQMKTLLDHYQIQYRPQDRKACIMELYDGMRAQNPLHKRKRLGLNSRSVEVQNNAEPIISKHRRQKKYRQSEKPNNSFNFVFQPSCSNIFSSRLSEPNAEDLLKAQSHSNIITLPCSSTTSLGVELSNQITRPQNDISNPQSSAADPPPVPTSTSQSTSSVQQGPNQIHVSHESSLIPQSTSIRLENYQTTSPSKNVLANPQIMSTVPLVATNTNPAFQADLQQENTIIPSQINMSHKSTTIPQSIDQTTLPFNSFLADPQITSSRSSATNAHLDFHADPQQENMVNSSQININMSHESTKIPQSTCTTRLGIDQSTFSFNASVANSQITSTASHVATNTDSALQPSCTNDPQQNMIQSVMPESETDDDVCQPVPRCRAKGKLIFPESDDENDRESHNRSTSMANTEDLIRYSDAGCSTPPRDRINDSGSQYLPSPDLASSPDPLHAQQESQSSRALSPEDIPASNLEFESNQDLSSNHPSTSMMNVEALISYSETGCSTPPRDRSHDSGSQYLPSPDLASSPDPLRAQQESQSSRALSPENIPPSNLEFESNQDLCSNIQEHESTSFNSHCMRPDTTTQKSRATKQQMIPDDLPPSKGLKVNQMKKLLDKYQVSYKTRDRKPRIIELYDAMRIQHRIHATKQACKGQRSGSNSRQRAPAESEDNQQPVVPQHQRRKKYRRQESPSGFSMDLDEPNINQSESTGRTSAPHCCSSSNHHRSMSTRHTHHSSTNPLNILNRPSAAFLENSQATSNLMPSMNTSNLFHNDSHSDHCSDVSMQNASDHELASSAHHQNPVSSEGDVAHARTDQDVTMASDCDPDVANWRNSVGASQGNSDHNIETGQCTTLAKHTQFLEKIAYCTSKSLEIEKRKAQKLDEIIDALHDVALSNQATSSFTCNAAGGSHPRQHNKQKAPTCRPVPQGGVFHELIRIHVSTLLGNRKKHLPHPPGHSDRYGSPMEIDENSDTASNSPHPGYPYPNGPGHSTATKETLDIIWRRMQEAGIESFRPDWTKPCNHPDNKYLWNLAVDSFVELVECGEYTGIDLEMHSKEEIENALHLHVTQRLRRRYREENQWDEDKKLDLAKRIRCTARLHNLRHKRLATLNTLPGFEALVPIVQGCCSDDDSDDEFGQSIQISYRKNQPKQCVVWPVPWRHSRISDLMVTLDTLRARALESTPKGPSGAPARMRRRDYFVQTSQLEPKQFLPKGCFDGNWVHSQRKERIQALGIRSVPKIQPLIDSLKELL